MRWMAILLTAILGLGLWDASYHQAYAKKHHHKRAHAHIHKKHHKKHYKKHRKKHYSLKKGVKRVVVKPPRKVNDPREGELLKLEGMIKDLNEQ